MRNSILEALVDRALGLGKTANAVEAPNAIDNGPTTYAGAGAASGALGFGSIGAMRARSLGKLGLKAGITSALFGGVLGTLGGSFIKRRLPQHMKSPQPIDEYYARQYYDQLQAQQQIQNNGGFQ